MSIASRLSAAEQAAQQKAKLAALAQERIFREREEALEMARLASEQAVRSLQLDKRKQLPKQS